MGDDADSSDSNEAGRPVYERIGYATVSRHTLLMEKRFLEEH